MTETVENPDELILKLVFSKSVDPFSFLTIASVELGVLDSNSSPVPLS